MRCPIARSLLDEYIQQTLNPTTTTELEEHLAGCEECSRLLAEKRGPSLVAGIKSEKADMESAAAESVSSSDSGRSREARGAQFIPSADQNAFVPVSQSQAGTEQIRRRLEEMGVVFPEPDRMPHPQSLTPSVQAEDELPLQQLMRRFQPAESHDDMPFAPVAPREALSSVSAVSPKHFDIVAEEIETAGQTLVAVDNREKVQVSSAAETPKSILIDDESIDKSDDRLWVDIVITHHVTRNQIRKRVRRDSPEAIRYLAENGEDDEDSHVIGELAPRPDDGDDSLNPSIAEVQQSNEEVGALHNGLLQVDSAAEISDGARILYPDLLEPVSQPEDDNEEKMLSADLPDQDPEQAHVVVIPELMGEAEEPSDDSKTESAATVILSDQDQEVDVTLQNEDDFSVADEADDVDGPSNEDELQFHLPEGYDPEARPIQRPVVPPTQTNPIVSKPAEMGKERLVRQSRFSRDQESMIVRDQAAAAPSASFSRMRRLESLRRNPLPLVGLVVVLALALIFLVGMLVTALQSPLAQVHQKLGEDLQLWQQNIDALRNVSESDAVVLFYPEPFRLKEDTGTDNLQLQLTDLNRLYQRLQASLTACQQDRQNKELVDEAKLFIEAISESYTELVVELKRGSYPRSPSEWQKIQSLQEPVETLALLYERTGSIHQPSRASLWSEEMLQYRIAQLPLLEAVEPIHMQRFLSRRDGSDTWEITLSKASDEQREDYLLQLDDSSGHLIRMWQQSERSLHLLSRDEQYLEAFAEELCGNGRRYFYLGESSVTENSAGSIDSIVVMAPLENRYFFPEYPLLILLGSELELLGIVNTSSEDLHLGAASDSVVDLFQAANLARHFLNVNVTATVDAEGYIADLSHGILGEPRRAWLYRLKQGGSWQEVLVDGEECLTMDTLASSLVAYYFDALISGQE